jgi:hypothetical protein
MSKMKRNGDVVKLGSVFVTPGARSRLNMNDILIALLTRHMAGDWGDVDADDWKENDHSVKNGYRILSSYVDRNVEKFWIITEADRSATTILLPEEY